MKIGIISDIHSNILALEETFKRFEKENVEKVICIGDIIGIGPYPEKCVDFIIENKDKFLVCIRCNHENYRIKGIPRKNHNDENAKPLSDEQIAFLNANIARLNDKQVEFITSLKNGEYIEVEGKRIIIEHYPLDENEKFKKFILRPTAEEIEELFKDKKGDIYLFGHTHEKCHLEINNKHYINPGSLGCPIDSIGANAGILEITESKIRYEQIDIEYDIQKVISDMREIDFPLCNHMIERFYRKN